MKFSDFPKQVIKENVDYTVKEITNVIKKYGPRESGNENCLAAQKHIKKEMDQFCDETRFESYQMAPKAFLHFTKLVSTAVILTVIVCAILVFCGVITFWLAGCIATGVFFVCLLITVMEFLLYKPFMDPLYKKVEGHNFCATRKASGETKRRIIISGHIDAAYVWRHTHFAGAKYMTALMAAPIGTIIASFVIGLVTVIAGIVNMGVFGDFLLEYSYYFHFITAICMVSILLFVDFSTISPGANDNLTGTYAAVCALRMLDMAGVQFENTEVCCMITDGEEAGLRGCKQWAKDHYDEYMNGGVETAVLCVDTLTDLEDLNVYSRDMTGLVKNSEPLSNLVMESAKECGHEDLEFSAVFFGSSDAAAFSQAGITATCLAAMDPSPADYYHNCRDSYDRLVPKAIETGYEIIVSTILNFDEKGLG